MQQKTLNLLKDLSVLIVEDDKVASSIIKDNLERYCGAVYEAADGIEGLAVFKKYRTDVIITDVHLPIINGFEMIDEILKLKPEQLFIVMTSYYENDQNLISSMHHGACSFLHKPVDIEELLKSLLMLLSRFLNTVKQLSPEISVDGHREIIYKNGEPIFLSEKNNQLFWLLYYNLDRMVTYEMFENYAYDGESISRTALNMVIMRIKQHLGDVVIKNSVNVGYVLKSYH